MRTKNPMIKTGIYLGLSKIRADTIIKDTGSMEILDKGSENIFVANSLEELAAKTRIDQDALLITIDEYNKACDTGRDELFHKKPKYLRAIKQPKFYAGSLGGIRTNERVKKLLRFFTTSNKIT